MMRAAGIILFWLVAGFANAADLINDRNDLARKLTSISPQSAQNPSFSPDGTRIVYTRFLEGYNAGASEIVVMDVDGGNSHILVPSLQAGNVTVPFGSWVGDEICFASDRAGLADEIWIVQDDGSNLRQITTHSEEGVVSYIEPVFNPQSAKQIVFEHVTGADDETAIHQIAYLDVPSGEIAVMTDGAFDDRLPSWSPDGEWILFQRKPYGQDGGWKAYIAPFILGPRAPTLSFIREVNHGAPEFTEYTDCSWASDSRAILCSSPVWDSGVSNIWLFPTDLTQPPIRITDNKTAEDGAPSQSPDGRQTVFESHLGNDEEYPSEIWVVNN